MSERMTPSEVSAFVMQRLDQKQFRAIWSSVPAVIEAFYASHLRYIDSVDEDAYDEDDAFEWIYADYLASHPDNDDEDLQIADLLDGYFEALDDL